MIYGNNLNWKYHIEHLTKLARKFFNIFKTLRLFLDTKVLRIVYYSLVNSIISYGVSIWGGTFKTNLTLLNTTVNSLIKYILKKQYLTPTNVIYTIFNVNNIEKLHRNHLLLLLYKYKHLIRKPTHNIGTRLKKKTNANTPI